MSPCNTVPDGRLSALRRGRSRRGDALQLTEHEVRSAGPETQISVTINLSLLVTSAGMLASHDTPGKTAIPSAERASWGCHSVLFFCVGFWFLNLQVSHNYFVPSQEFYGYRRRCCNGKSRGREEFLVMLMITNSFGV